MDKSVAYENDDPDRALQRIEFSKSLQNETLYVDRSPLIFTRIANIRKTNET